MAFACLILCLQRVSRGGQGLYTQGETEAWRRGSATQGEDSVSRAAVRVCHSMLTLRFCDAAVLPIPHKLNECNNSTSFLEL